MMFRPSELFDLKPETAYAAILGMYEGKPEFPAPSMEMWCVYFKRERRSRPYLIPAHLEASRLEEAVEALFPVHTDVECFYLPQEERTALCHIQLGFLAEMIRTGDF